MSDSLKAYYYLNGLKFHSLFISSNVLSDTLFNHYHTLSDKENDIKILEDNNIPYEIRRTIPEFSENNFRIDIKVNDVISIIRDKKINSILNE